MSNTGTVCFVLRGDFKPEELSEAIGILPTNASMGGERIPGKSPKCSLWEYAAEEIENEIFDVYDLSRELVNDLLPYAENIATEVKKRDLGATLQVVLWISTDNGITSPAIGFEAPVISFLHHVGASIDIDTYRNSAEKSERPA